jgi:hypothetical protein
VHIKVYFKNISKLRIKILEKIMKINFIGHGLNDKNKLNIGDQIATSLISSNFDIFTGFLQLLQQFLV